MYTEQIKTSIHNRFDIEVIRDGKVIQKAMAENMVLDRAFTRLCNFQSYFTRINFGTGNGTIAKFWTTFLEPLGSKEAVDEEIIKAFPVTKWTRKIVLNPEEYVGEIIREVGISDSASVINTHAFITDVEGNPLSVEKTGLDIVVIYASVFIQFNETDTLKFYKAEDNELLRYLTGGIAPTNKIYLDASDHISSYPQLEIGDKTATATADVENKKRILTTRFGVDEGNVGNKVAAITWDKVFRTTTIDLFSGANITDHIIGTGDGIMDTFPLKFTEIQNLIVKRDGSQISEATYTRNGVLNPAPTPQPLYYFMEVDEAIPDGFNGSRMDNYGYQSSISGKRLRSLENCKFISKVIGIQSVSYYLGYSNDNINFEEVRIGYGSSNNEKILEMPDVDIDSYEYIKLRIHGHAYNNIQSLAFCAPSDSNTIKFNTPPANGEVISINGYVPYLPKSTDYVLDVTLELKFGEGI